MERNLITFEVAALCSSPWGIPTYKAFIEYDKTKPIEEFFKECRSRMFFMGANAILHWTAIDGNESAKCVFHIKESEATAKKILSIMEERQFYHRAFNLYAKRAYDLKHGRKAKEKYEDGNIILSENKYTGEWQVGCWTEKRIQEELRHYDTIIGTYNSCLESLGFDVEDKAKQKRILTNLGFYRVP